MIINNQTFIVKKIKTIKNNQANIIKQIKKYHLYW